MMGVNLVGQNVSDDFVQKGQLLAKQLGDCEYKPDSIEAWCQRVHGFSAEYARKLIRAAAVVDSLSRADPPLPYLPGKEDQTRPLAPLEEEDRIAVWRAICKTIPTPAQVTARAVREAVKTIAQGDLTAADVGDPVFPSDNELGIPLLLYDLQPDALHLPYVLWGAAGRNKSYIGATAHFYTDDARFADLYRDPTPIINAGFYAAVEPNFSIYAGTPRVVGLGRIFQKRWIARWWQSQGIPVLVDMNVNHQFLTDNLLGVPFGWRSYATRGYADRPDQAELEYLHAAQHAGTDQILFVVYGGGSALELLAAKYGWVWMPSPFAGGDDG